VVPNLASIENMDYNPCDQSGVTNYPGLPLYSNTYFICSLTIPLIVDSIGVPYVETEPTLTTVCTNPIPQIPTSVGTCSIWAFTNNLSLGESVTFIYTDCDRFNYVMTVDSSWDSSSFSICSFHGPTFISGSPTNNVFQRLLVLQNDDYCGCYYGCASGFECIPIARLTSGIDPDLTEQWELPLCGGNNFPTLTTVQITINSANSNILGYGPAYTACTANPFEWWAFYTEQFTFNNCANFTTTYPLNIPSPLDTIPPGFTTGEWGSIVNPNIPIFNLPYDFLNSPELIGSSCGCSDIGFASESCVVLRDCCTGNIVYTGTIMNDNYSWVENNYTVDNLGLTDCCLYLDVFIPPTIIQGIDTSQILKSYQYPSTNGYITEYITTGCGICLNPTPSPTTTPTPTPTPFPSYYWMWDPTSPQNSFTTKTSSNLVSTNSCDVRKLIINPISLQGNVSSLLNSLVNGDRINIFDPSTSKQRTFQITSISLVSSKYELNITPTNTSCPTYVNFDFIFNNSYGIKFLKR
jgi:hypothetical protein